ncbi:MAG: hypothetical protein GX245_01330 [Eubacteriaceae bacterium]|jgi:hypothetical protein|nr:hypothetical protein [Eubacteriaceae bacterium]
MNIKKENEKTIIEDEQFEIHIFKKVFKGYILKKFLKGSFFDLIEQREINVELTEDQLLQTAQDMLKPLYSL